MEELGDLPLHNTFCNLYHLSDCKTFGLDDRNHCLGLLEIRLGVT